MKSQNESYVLNQKPFLLEHIVKNRKINSLVFWHILGATNFIRKHPFRIWHFVLKNKIHRVCSTLKFDTLLILFIFQMEDIDCICKIVYGKIMLLNTHMTKVILILFCIFDLLKTEEQKIFFLSKYWNKIMTHGSGN